MTLPSLPVKGSTDWYPWVQGVDTAVRSGGGKSGTVSVQDYGAKGDGTTDDTAAIQAALAAAQSGKKPLYFPTGSYKVTAPLGAINIRATRLIGDGPQLSRIIATGLAQNAWLMTLGWDSASGVDSRGPAAAISGLTLIGDATATAANGVQLSNSGTTPHAHGMHFADVGWYGFNTQLSFGSQSYINSFHRCRFDNPMTRAVSMIDPLSNAGENMSFVSCTFADGYGDALVFVDTGADMFFYGCSFDYSPRALWQRAGHISMIGCHFEANSYGAPAIKDYILVDRRGQVSQPMLSLVDCQFNAYWDAYDTCIRMTGSPNGGSALRLVNSYIWTGATMAPYFIRDDGPAPSDVSVTGLWVSDGRYIPRARDNAGSSYRLPPGVDFHNRPERSVRRIGSGAIEPFPVVQARGVDTVDSGTLFVTFFSPKEDITLSSVAFWTGATGQTGATLLKVGLYEWDTPQISLRVSSASNTSLATAAFTRYTAPLTASYTCLAGGVYGLALLVVGASTAPVVVSSGNSNDWVMRDGTYGHPQSVRVTGQTDLQSVIFNGSQFSSPKTFYLVGVGS